LIVTQPISAYATAIFQVTRHTSEKRQLTFPAEVGYGDSQPALSPDGLTLAFVRAFKSDEVGDIYVVPVSGGKTTRLTNDNQMVLGLAWTPDGHGLLFSSDRKGWPRLWRIDAARKNPAIDPAVVVGAGDDARFPSISQGGNGVPGRLVYERFTRDFDIRRAELVDSDAGREKTLKASTQFVSSTRKEYSPGYSPDGSSIVFVSDRSGPLELWLSGTDGSNPVKLTSFGGPAVIMPQWSPDGKQILFSALTGLNGTFESYAIYQAGGPPKRISPANDSEFWGHPVLSRDGRWIYIASTSSGSLQVWKMPSAGGKSTQITHESGYRPLESPDGKFLYYGRHDRPGVWRVPVGGGEERRLLDSVGGRNWTVTKNGIYYFDFTVQPGEAKRVKFYSFRSGKSQTVGVVEPTVSTDFSGISVSADERWLLYSHIASTTSDLMLLDNFR
jgi:Tol biopolymer transport system component